MIVFHYDKTFEGLLTAVFDAYNRKTFPHLLLATEEQEPLFVEESYSVITDQKKSKRVWEAVSKKISKTACNMLTYSWLADGVDMNDWYIFNYFRKVIDNKHSIETNFADSDVLKIRKLAKEVSKEKHHIIQFVRFQKTSDNIYFAVVAPKHNVLPAIINHFKDRYADQQWIIYDSARRYGYYYDKKDVQQITFENDRALIDGKLNDEILADDEKLFQNMWRRYFDALAIKERINPKLQRQHMPRRFWKYLTEKQ